MKIYQSSKLTRITLKQALPYIFLVVGVVGCIASFALTYDKIHVLQDPSYRPACNINPILSCGSVMKTQQASLFGVPNTVFGLMGFSGIIVLGLTLLAGASYRKWLWRTINLGVLGGFGFFLYLFFQGVYRINAICPYCFIIWMIMPPLLWYLTLYNLAEGNVKLGFVPIKVKAFLRRHHGDVLVSWYLFIFILLLTHFWYYWRTVI